MESTPSGALQGAVSFNSPAMSEAGSVIIFFISCNAHQHTYPSHTPTGATATQTLQPASLPSCSQTPMSQGRPIQTQQMPCLFETPPQSDWGMRLPFLDRAGTSAHSSGGRCLWPCHLGTPHTHFQETSLPQILSLKVTVRHRGFRNQASFKYMLAQY